jgi:hypothetical protein
MKNREMTLMSEKKQYITTIEKTTTMKVAVTASSEADADRRAMNNEYNHVIQDLGVKHIKVLNSEENI